MKVTFLLLDGFSNLVLSCLLEPLRMLHDLYQEDVEWGIVTPNDAPVASSSNLLLSPTVPVGEVDSPDLLIIISSNGYRQHPTPENQRLVMTLVRQSGIIVGADAGAWLLASTGLLDDLNATLHWQVLCEFAETFPHVRVSQENYVMEGRFWSCGGASTALELMLAFITDRFGSAKAFMASSMFISDASLQQDEARLPTALTPQRKNRLDAIKNIMVETIEHPLSLTALAERANLSPRSISRLFKSEVGMSPGQYYQQLRLSYARDLAENTSFGLQEIALRCGYSDAAALSKAFTRVYGQPVRRFQKSGQPAAQTQGAQP